MWKQLLAILMVVSLLVGCASNGNDEAEQANTEGEAAEEQTSSEDNDSDDTYPLTIRDAMDNEVTFEEAPKKIVSLIPSNTEILFSLGLGDRVVGVSDFANYPEEAASKEKIGGQELNIEKILSLEPDVVMAHASGAHNSEQGLQQLRDAGIPVYVVQDATSFESVYDTLASVGKITGTSGKASTIVEEMKASLVEIKQKADDIPNEEKKKVFMEVSPAPEIYTTGKGTFLNEMLNTINATNAVGDQEGWIKMNNEAIVELQPEVIVTTYGYYTENPKEKVMSREGWDSVPAIKEEQVYDVHSDLVTRPGPRLIEGVNELAKAVYPDTFQ
ncbi:ABC transporter substrate-binding protein [Pontibacillus salicampi]|uniref:ABC transporter substrate-binding protein n=2 Tax=Pontibacillus salicampi TaxID=1449801 RepID=A0ABV6LK04_9BACI